MTSKTPAFEVYGGLRILPLRTLTIPPATHTNAYIVGEEGFVVIDPGATDPAEQEVLHRLVDALLGEGRTFEAIVLTHEHPDHIGGVEALVARYQAPVWAHALTATAIAGLQPTWSIARELVDAEVLDLGAGHRLRCIHTPGHARGHLSFHHQPSDTILVGDLVASQGTIVIDPPSGNMSQYLASLARLIDEAPRALLPAHGWVITRPQQHLQHYIDHRTERENQVMAALIRHGRPASPLELVPLVYTEIPHQVWPLAARSLLAHLEHMVERGVAREYESGQFWTV